MSNQEIISICQQLSAQGKDPSVALIKARLSTPVPMPLIIAGLKQWRANPDIKLDKKELELKPDSNTDSTLADRVSVLEKEVEELKNIIRQLTKTS